MQQLSEMANGVATVMADGDGNCDGRRWRRRQWPTAAMVTAMADGDATEMAAAMVDSNLLVPILAGAEFYVFMYGV